MVYFKVILLLPLCYLLSPIAGQDLKFNEHGRIFYQDDRTGLLRSTCLKPHQDAATTCHNEKTNLTLLGVASRAAKFRSKDSIDDLRNTIEHLFGKVAAWQFDANYAHQRVKLYSMLLNGMEQPNGNLAQNGNNPTYGFMVSLPVVSASLSQIPLADYTSLFRNSKGDKVPDTIPIVPSHCKPEKNPECTEDQIKEYHTFVMNRIRKMRKTSTRLAELKAKRSLLG